MKWRVQFKQALAMLRDSCSAAESFSTFVNLQMRRVWGEAVRVHRPSWTELRQQAGITFWVSILGLVMFTAFIWSFDLIDGVYNKTLLNLLYTAVPLSVLLERADARASRRRFDWWHLGFVLVILAFLLIAISDRLDRPLLGLNVFLILMSAPFLLVFGNFIWRTPLLGVELVPSTVIAEAFLVVTASSEGIRVEHLLFPLPIVLMGSVIWTLVARFFLTHARQRRQAAIWGPAMESAAMIFMFLPLTLLATVVPIVVTDDRTWLAVSVTIIGVSFGSVVSTPLRQFLLDLGQLPPIRRWEGNADGESHEERDL